MVKELPVLFKDKEECCGCSACYTTCPRKAINMVTDEDGFDYPEIDDNKCVGCQMCLKICPFK